MTEGLAAPLPAPTPAAVRLADAAAQVLDRLRARQAVAVAALGLQTRLGAARQVAVVVLALEQALGARRKLAVSAAMRAYCERSPMSPSLTRKVASEARALLQYGLPGSAWEGGEAQVPESWDGLLEQLEIVVGELSVRRTSQARVADQRRRGDDDLAAWANRLVTRASRGDQAAAAELARLKSALRAWRDDPGA